MKIRKGTVIKGVVAAVALAALAFIARDAGFWPRPAYDASEPTEAKFRKISRWIPEAAELTIALDVHRAMGDEALWAMIEGLAAKAEGVAAELIQLKSSEERIGMLLLVGILGERGERPRLALIAQGEMDEGTLGPAIRTALSSGRAGLVASVLAGHTLYTEGDERDPLGVLFLDRLHMAIGRRDSLAALFGDEGAKGSPSLFGAADSVIFGRLVFGPRLAQLLPEAIAPVGAMEFQSVDGRQITARVPRDGPGQAEELKIFLEGARSLLILQSEGNQALQEILAGVAIAAGEREVTISCEVLPLIGAWQGEG